MPPATGPRSKTDAVAGLREVDARRRILHRTENGGVGIRNRFEKGQAGGNDANAEEKGPEGSDLRRGDEPEAADRHHQQSGDDAAFVTELRRQPAGRQCHQEVAQIVRELHPGRLRQGQMQLLLKVLVHHIDHPVAESPKRKEEDQKHENEEDVAAIFQHEHAPLRREAWIERSRPMFRCVHKFLLDSSA